MSVLYLVLPLALVLVTAAVLGYVWASRQGQFDDLTTPAMRMVHDDQVTAARPAPPPAPDA
ncbi:MAG: cbb3-type cytochrome oxidase assembly protein CcoS [Gemmatimonadales bacterium]|nr:cbb3-type cytochrome oxidase assembly protein CcoS [Gemmatimonadales bacterium]